MFKDAFVKIEGATAKSILKDINPHIEGTPYDPATVTLLGQTLSFYKGYQFLDVANYDAVPAARHFVIYKAGNPVILNWTNEPLYRLNREAPIHLTEKNITEYVQFFFAYIRGRHGRFQIVEKPDDISWKEEPPPTARKAIAKMIEPLELLGKDKDGAFHLVARMMFRDSLFKTDIHVRPDGLVTLAKEELLIESMPVMDETLGQ